MRAHKGTRQWLWINTVRRRSLRSSWPRFARPWTRYRCRRRSRLTISGQLSRSASGRPRAHRTVAATSPEAGGMAARIRMDSSTRFSVYVVRRHPPRQPPGHRIDAVTGSTTSKARLHNPETAQPPPVVTAALSREDAAHHPSAMEPILPCLDTPSFPSPKPPCRLRGARQAALRLQTPPVAVEQASSSNNTTFSGVLEANLQTTPGLRLLRVGRILHRAELRRATGRHHKQHQQATRAQAKLSSGVIAPAWSGPSHPSDLHERHKPLR